jgi:nucleoside-diphosphate-sugar epimerase
MQHVLVTGAAGFIGSHLCEALLGKGFQVSGIDNFDSFYSKEAKEKNLSVAMRHERFSFLQGDAGDRKLLDTLSPVDIVVHLAARPGVLPSIKDPLSYIRTNVETTNNLLEWMKARGMRKMVFASSSSVYGNNAKIPFEETDSVNEPISPYAFTKRSCELMNYTYHVLYGFNIINLRFFTVFGERQRPDLAIHKFVRLLFSGKPITIYGDGKTARDYTYYTDTLQGILAAVNYVDQHDTVWQTLNLGNNSPVSLIDLVQTISEVAGIEPQLIYEDMKPGDVNITYANIDAAKKILGYKPTVSFETGITNFIRWFKKENNIAVS